MATLPKTHNNVLWDAHAQPYCLAVFLTPYCASQNLELGFISYVLYLSVARAKPERFQLLLR